MSASPSRLPLAPLHLPLHLRFHLRPGPGATQ